VPVVAGLIVARGGRRAPARDEGDRPWSGSIVGFAVTIPLVAGSRPERAPCSSSKLAPWIPRFNVNYHLGVDGISGCSSC